MSATLPLQAANGGPPGTSPGAPNPTYGSEVPNVVAPPAVDCPDTFELMTIKFSIPAANDGVVKPSPTVSKFLQILQMADDKAQILPKAEAEHLPSLLKPNNIPNNANGIADCASDLQHDAKRDQHVFYLRVRTKYCLIDIKHSIPHMYSWLFAKRIFITLHNHTSKNLHTIGWVKFMDASFGSREHLKTTLDHHLGGLEISFSLVNEFVWCNNKKIQVKVVAIMADAAQTNEVFRRAIDIFTDADILGLGKKELIPSHAKASWTRNRTATQSSNTQDIARTLQPFRSPEVTGKRIQT